MANGILIDVNLLEKEIIENELKNTQSKYLSAFTNINNLRSMLRTIRKDVKNNPDDKTLQIALDEHRNQLFSNKKAAVLHKNNILFLKKLLGE